MTNDERHEAIATQKIRKLHRLARCNDCALFYVWKRKKGQAGFNARCFMCGRDMALTACPKGTVPRDLVMSSTDPKFVTMYKVTINYETRTRRKNEVEYQKAYDNPNINYKVAYEILEAADWDAWTEWTQETVTAYNTYDLDEPCSYRSTNQYSSVTETEYRNRTETRKEAK